MRAANRALAEERAKAARNTLLEEEGTRLRAKAAENGSAIMAHFPGPSVRQRKLQGNGRILSKNEILRDSQKDRGEAVVICKQRT